MKGSKVKSNIWFRLVLFPLLFPLSLIYGFAALVKKKFSALNQVVLGFPVFSVGNFTVGGTGKTPLVTTLVKILLELGKEPVLISKSYKASLRIPAEVMLDSDVKAVGDEALLLKKTFPNLRVFSGPHKTKTALFAASKIIDPFKSVFVIDDGAQHHGVYKDFKIHVWDMSLHKIDMLPFPLGRSREFWFLGESPDLTILNRSNSPDKVSADEVPRVLRAHYPVVKISSHNNKELHGDFVLVSGLGNFLQLERAVDTYCADKDFKRIKSIEGRDHDSFDWFQAEANLSYVCTEKDFEKLKNKVSEEQIFIVKSEFSENFKRGFFRSIESFFKRGEE
jgi:tetraacyldisaccharide 4'-kinase